MSAFPFLFPIFLTTLISDISFLRPKTKAILDKLRDDTIRFIGSAGEEFNFVSFMSWHQTCHYLERRRSKFQTWDNVRLSSLIGGLLVSTFDFILSIFNISTTSWVTRTLNVAESLALSGMIISLFDPVILVCRQYKHLAKSEEGTEGKPK